MSIPKKFRKECQTCSELELFLIIEGLTYHVWLMKKEWSHGNMSKADHDKIFPTLPKVNEKAIYAAGQTTRFGVEVPMEPEGAGTDEYFSWLRWWKAYRDSLPETKWKLLLEDVHHKRNLDRWRPKGNWKTPAAAPSLEPTPAPI